MACCAPLQTRYGKLALIMFVWWMFIIKMLLNSVPSDNQSQNSASTAKHHQVTNSSAKATQEEVSAFVYPPVDYNKSQVRIDAMMKKLKLKTCTEKSKKLGDKCQDVTCLDIINGQNYAREFVEKTRALDKIFLTDNALKDQAFICDNIFEKGGYLNEVLTAEELDFPLAYSILVYKDAGQVETLLKTIYQPNNAYCIHIDEKSPDSFKDAIKALVHCFPNIVIASRSVRIVYAGFSRLYADIICMKDLLKSPHRWKYLINLAGTAMPLKTNWEMVKVLSLYNGTNDIEGLPLNRTIQDRFSHKWIPKLLNGTKNYKMQRTNITKSPPPHDLSIVRGSAYGAFSRAFVQFVMQDKMAADLLSWSMDTYSPDEHYWATLHFVYYNPQLRTPGGYKRPADVGSWISSYSSWPSEEPCFGKTTSRTSPCVFGMMSIPNLLQRPELFANKFEAHYEPIAQTCLGAMIQARTKCQTKFHIQHYRNLDVVKYNNRVRI